MRDCLNRIFGDFISSSPSHWKLLQSICLRIDHFLFLNVTIFYPSSKTCLNVGKKINAIRHCWSSVSVPSSLKKKKILSFPNLLWMALPDIWLDSRDNNKNRKGNSFEKKKMSKILTKVYRDTTLLPPLQESKLFLKKKWLYFLFFFFSSLFTFLEEEEPSGHILNGPCCYFYLTSPGIRVLQTPTDCLVLVVVSTTSRVHHSPS